MVKPFNNEELLLRVEAIIRRWRDDLSKRKPLMRSDEFAVGDLEILFGSYVVRKKGAPADLTAKEFEVLALLANDPGQVYTRSQIYEHLWGREGDADENSITVFVHKIREKIEDDSTKPRYLLTVWRVGYKFTDRI